MKQLFSNATVMWTEKEIILRESLIQIIYQILKETWTEINPAVRFERIETPTLTPSKYLEGHVKEGFPMIETKEHGYLRPEICGGIYEAFLKLHPQKPNRDKKLPLCLWQAGKSFREENNPNTMRASKLRLREFWQLEFELFCSYGTHADYMREGLNRIFDLFSNTGNSASIDTAPELPHYSTKTFDWHINHLEIGCGSIRKDLEGYQVHEISIGLDRLVATILGGENGS